MIYIGMSKTLNGANDAFFTNVTVEENELIKGNLTVNGIITGVVEAESSAAAPEFVATNTTGQFRTTATNLDLKATGVNPNFYFKNNSNITGTSTLFAGKALFAYPDSTSVQTTTQQNVTAGAAAGAALKAESDGSRAIQITAYASNHSTKPSEAEVKGTGVSFLTLNTSNTAIPVKIQVNGVDKFIVSNTGVTSSVPITLPQLVTPIVSATTVNTVDLNASGLTTTNSFVNQSSATFQGTTTTTGLVNTGSVATTTLGVSGLTTTTGITNTGNISTPTLNATTTSTTTLGVTGASTTTGLTNTGNIQTTTATITNGITANDITIAGSTVLNGATSTTFNVSGNATLGNLSVNGITNTGPLAATTLGVSGASTTTGLTNTGNIQTSTLNCTGNSTFTGTSLYNGIFVDTNTTDATANLTGSVVNYGGSFTAKNVWANTGVVMPYTQALKTIGYTVGNKYLDAQYSMSGGLGGDATYLYTPGNGGVESSGSATDYVLAANKVQVKLKQPTASTSTTTGAFVVAGGVGIGGNLNVGGTITGGSISYASTTTGTLTVSNGTGQSTVISSTEAATSTTTGAVKVLGGVGIGGNLHVGGTITGGAVTYGTTTSGTFAVTNGSGVTLTVASTDEITSDTSGGAVAIAGGLRVAKRIASLEPMYMPFNYVSGGTLGTFAGTYFYKEATRLSGSPWNFGRSVGGLTDQDKIALNYFGSTDTDTRSWISYPEGQTRFKSLAQQVFTLTTATNTQLVKGDGTIIVCTAGSGTAIVKLPSADTFGTIGVTYTFHNQHLTPWYVQNFSGTGIATMFKPGDMLILTLMNNATAAGVWQVVLDTSIYAKQSSLTGDSPNYTPAVTVTNTSAGVGSSAVAAFLTPSLALNQETVLQVGQDSVRQLQLGFTNAALGEIFLGFPGGDQLRYKTNQLKIGDGNYFQYKYGTWTPVMWANYSGSDEFGFPYVPTALTSTFSAGTWERIGNRMTLYFEIIYSYVYFGANFRLFVPNIPFRPAVDRTVEDVMSSLCEMAGAEKPLYSRIPDTSVTYAGFSDVMIFTTVYGQPVNTLAGQTGQRVKGSISFTV